MGGDHRSGGHAGTARYCSNCGTDIEPSTNYCPSCGAATGNAAGRSTDSTAPDRSWTAGRTDRGDGTDRERLERRIATALEEGWELERDFGDHAVLIKRSLGSAGVHALIALFTIWFTMGIGNALYAGYKYFGDVERTVVRPESGARMGSVSADDSVSAQADATANGSASAGSYSVGRIFVVGLLWLFGLALLLEGSLLASGFGLLLLVTGAAMSPSVRRRIRDREPITTTGRTRSVEETVVRSPERPCAVCHDSIAEGIERRYRERVRLLGVSIVTTDRGANYYCHTCAGLGSITRDRGDGSENETETADAAATTETGTKTEETGAETERSAAEPTETNAGTD
ncbi:zinc-ribbon domain-containing protein [Haloterrigena alkaliphila]|uniref:Zinc-ribbon domain-containing protein n=1 Tax=Haloterrigena alkaliphila TaxID=2816475 RepID=A0A8A2VDC4_9EURY|nr:zinc ribbon domain-containing protein [Haloterrigena alkaliphila]QSW99226.1 zinc ribbon domain-containing protein [Haloterrigena alkaliphila]